MENYPLEEGIENTWENLRILTEVNQVYDSESMESRMRGIDVVVVLERERKEEAKCMVKYVLKI